MGLYDRDYGRPAGSGGWRIGRGGRGGGWGGGGGLLRSLSVNNWLIVINVAVFVAGVLLSGVGSPVLATAVTDSKLPVRIAGDYQVLTLRGAEAASDAQRSTPGTVLVRPLVARETGQIVGRATYTVEPVLYAWGHFSTYLGFMKIEVWRLVTFQFLHAGPMHLLFNMLGLYMFGRMVEDYLGGRKYLAFYLVCGIFGGLLYLLLNGLGVVVQVVGLPRVPGLLFTETTTPLVGASAGVFGVIMACAFIAPSEQMRLLIPPVTLRMKTMAYTFVGIAAAGLILGSRNAGGEAAHLGGAIAGFFFIRNSHLLHDFFDLFEDSRRGPKGVGRSKARGTGAGAGKFGAIARSLGRGSDGGGNVGASAAAGGSKPSDAEVDRILAKVQAGGIGSLTEAEKQALRRATEAMR